ncbi:palmitoyltransferase akr1 [Rhodotorula kratochvilovae]
MASPLSPGPKASATTSLSSLSPPPPPAASSSSAAAAPPPQDEPTPLPPLHAAAQQGDVVRIFALLDAPPAEQHAPLTASDPDAQGITPLHWAAINGNVVCAKALLDRGAEVDARGGDLQGTPVMWAARNGHLAVVHLLLKYGADPTLLDSQGFNIQHLAVHSSSAFLLAYLLFTLQPLAIDASDPEGHTSLAWACYQGDAISVELLLAAGASPSRTDAAGLTPLHWAVTKGNATCIRRIASAPGADLHARNADGKTAREMALQLKSYAAYARALSDAGMDESGKRVDSPLGEKNTRRAIFAVVAGAMGAAFGLGAHTPWYVALLAVPAAAFAMHHVVVRVLLGAGGAPAAGGGHGHGHGHGHGGAGERVTKSPYLCAIITASLGWCAWVWATRFVGLHAHTLLNIVFLALFSTCAYNFYRAVTLDPGTVRGPPPGGEEMKEVIEELVEAGAFNGMNFCLTCLVRRPLRSKHSYATERCVARFDHYCPWVWNDVGVNNHRQFLLFLTSLVFGVMAFMRLTYGYFYEKAPDLPPTASCPSLSPTLLCMSLLYDPFALLVSFWASLQLTWTIILLAAQLWQVARQLTTLEQSNLGRYGYMGGKPGVSGAAQQGAVEKWTAARASAHDAQAMGDAGDGGEDDPASLAHAPARADTSSPSAGSPRAKGRMAFLLRLLGLDRFLSSSSSSSSGASRRSRRDQQGSNPFDLGPWTNCADFWTQGGELGVRYEELYGVPEGGFRRAVAERKAREREERERVGGGGRWRRGSEAGAGGRGYERVPLGEV